MVGALIGAGASIALSAINNAAAASRAEKDRQANYYLNEQAAQYADARTRKLYNDFYSPQALIQQYKAAGLSPSMMFGGTPGQGGIAGAQSQGSQGLQTQYMPISMLEGAQIAAIQAQTEKTKAETANINEDTKIKELQTIWDDMRNKEKSVDFNLATGYIINKDGSTTSLFELAGKCYDYEQFMETARKTADEDLKLIMGSEAGQKTMRKIFLDSNRFERDIKVLSKEGLDANFQRNVLNAMSKEGFAEQNAKTTISQLEAAAETADLTKEQRSAWNNMLEKMRNTSSTATDIMIILSMIFNQAQSNWKK